MSGDVAPVSSFFINDMTRENIDIIQGLANRCSKYGLTITVKPDVNDASCVIINADNGKGKSEYRTTNYGRARYAVMYLYHQHVEMMYATADSELFSESLRLAKNEGITKLEMDNIDLKLKFDYD